ncbi:MAG: 3-phenylpropionate/cinnamic acid dioxygenase subunit beta [Burkholderiales bacterium]
MSLDTLHEVEQFLYREARLLDRRQFREWLELFTDDVHYWMPMRTNRYPKSSKALKILNPDIYPDGELTRSDELALLDESKGTLTRRIERLETGMAWGEDPPSRTRHLITNIEIEALGSVDELRAYSNFLVYRTRSETEEEFFIGSREDLLRRVDGAWKIARRQIVLDQTVLSVKNISIFF